MVECGCPSRQPVLLVLCFLSARWLRTSRRKVGAKRECGAFRVAARSRYLGHRGSHQAHPPHERYTQGPAGGARVCLGAPWGVWAARERQGCCGTPGGV